MRRLAAKIRSLLWLAGVALVLAAPAAWADESAAPSVPPAADAAVAPPEPEGEAEVAPVIVRATPDADEASASHAAPEAARALDDPAFVTVTVLDDEHHEATSVAEVMARSVGVNVRTLGGVGAFTSISVRGAPSSQTVVLIDGVPLSRMAYSAIDLGSFDLATYDGVEVYRGSVPVEMGGAALGGAVNFTTAVGPLPGQAPMTLSLAGGSFGARQARLVRRDRFGDAGRLATTVSLGYAGATGDFSYFYDNLTPLNTSDDSVQVRSNNRYDQLDGAARTRWKSAGGLALEGGARLVWRSQGVPGSAGQMARRSELSTRRGVFDVRTRRTGAWGVDALDVGGSAHLVVESQRYLDPDGEVGLNQQDRDYLTIATGASLSAAWALSDTQLAGAAVEPRLEWFRETDNLGGSAAARGVRWGGALSLSDSLASADERWLLVPALRADVLLMRPSGGTGDQVSGSDTPAARNDVQLSPRMSLRWSATPAVALKSSLGRYFRAPTLVELYGDRGYIVGNPLLRPETGVSGDLGLVFAPAAAHGVLDRIFVEAALFASRPKNLIAWLPSAARVLVAGNLGNARLAGAELSLAGRFFGALTLTGNYTFLFTRQDSARVDNDGKALPGRPAHELYARVDGGRRLGRFGLAAHADLTFTTGNFLDVANLERVPTRHFVGVGSRLDAPYGLSLALECRNLLDERVEDVPLASATSTGRTSFPRAVSDVLGYPLPGRSLMLTVSADF